MWRLDFFKVIDLEVFDIYMLCMYIQRTFNNFLNVFLTGQRRLSIDLFLKRSYCDCSDLFLVVNLLLYMYIYVCITCFYNRIFLKKNHENRENGLVASYEGSFVEKVFDLTNKFIPSVQRSRLSFFHRSNQKEDLNERRTSLFKQWGIVYLYYQFIFTETPFISNLS